MEGIVGIAGRLLMVVVAAAMGEGAIEFVLMPFLDLLKGKVNENVRLGIVQGLSAAVGVGIALTFNLGLFCFLSDFAGVAFAERWAGSDNLITGILVGRGSNYVHMLVKRFALNSQAKATETEATRAYAARAY